MRVTARARVQTEIDEHKAVAVLIDKEVSHLEANLCSAESSLQDASGCLEKLEVAAAHMKETTRVLGDQLNLSLQQIESSTEGWRMSKYSSKLLHVTMCVLQPLRSYENAMCPFARCRTKHTERCGVTLSVTRSLVPTHSVYRASVESLIRSIVNEDAQMRGYAVEISQLKQSISDIEEKKAALLPVLESCKNGLGELDDAVYFCCEVHALKRLCRSCSGGIQQTPT